jgi:hypothetical protein
MKLPVALGGITDIKNPMEVQLSRTLLNMDLIYFERIGDIRILALVSLGNLSIDTFTSYTY